MDRIIRQTNPVQGVAFGQTPTLDLPLGPRYRSLLVEFIATAAAAKVLTLQDLCGLINLKIGGKVQRAHTATELDAINKSYGAQYGSNAYNYDGGALAWSSGVPQAPQAAKQTVFYLPIFFREPWRKSYAAQEMFSWYTSWQNGSVLPSFQVEFQVPAISANVLAGNVPVINVYAETDNSVGPLDSNKQPVANITKWKRMGLPYSGAGDLVVTNLWKQEMYTQISLFAAYGTGKGPITGSTAAQMVTDQNDLTAFDYISKAKVEVDSRIVRDAAKIVSDQTLIDNDFNESGLPADRLDIVFDHGDLPSDGLIMQTSPTAKVQDFRVTATLATAASAIKTIGAVAQIYGAIE